MDFYLLNRFNNIPTKHADAVAVIVTGPNMPDVEMPKCIDKKCILRLSFSITEHDNDCAKNISDEQVDKFLAFYKEHQNRKTWIMVSDGGMIRNCTLAHVISKLAKINDNFLIKHHFAIVNTNLANRIMQRVKSENIT